MQIHPFLYFEHKFFNYGSKKDAELNNWLKITSSCNWCENLKWSFSTVVMQTSLTGIQLFISEQTVKRSCVVFATVIFDCNL